MRIIRNIFLIAVFSVLAGSIALAFIAEMNFLAADRLIKTYRWKEALGLYETASSLDPLNTKYITAIGDFYLRRSAEKREQMAQFFEKAEPFYTLAAELNPRCAEYTITLGRIQTGLFLEDEKVYEDRLAPGLAYLIRSIRNDPNGYNTSFMAGYTVLPFWDSLSEDDRSVVEDKLRYVLEDRPWRGSDYIYPAIWKYTQDFDLIERVRPDNLESNRALLYFIEKSSLGQFYLRQRKTVDLYLEEEYPEESRAAKEEDEALLEALAPASGKVTRWAGMSADRKYAYEWNSMYWTGTMRAPVEMPGGEVTVTVKAKSTPAGGVFPYMIVDLDGEPIGETFVKSAEWKDHSFRATTEPGTAVLGITYANDAAKAIKGEDRNLYIKEAVITKNE